MKAPLLVVGAILFIFLSCNKTDEVLSFNEQKPWLGSWIIEGGDSIETYTKIESLGADQMGFSFLESGKFVERKIEGWCGTPPVTFVDFDGNWSLTDSVLTIHVGHTGGYADYRFKIVSATKDRLTVAVLSRKYNYLPD